MERYIEVYYNMKYGIKQNERERIPYDTWFSIEFVSLLGNFVRNQFLQSKSRSCI